MATYQFRVSGMTCEGCAIKVKTGLERFAGVRASVDYGTARAEVLTPNHVSADLLAEAIRVDGYGARLLHAGHSDDAQAGAAGELHIAIIGSGGGAFAAAIRAAEAGARVTMIEAGTIGGTCVNVGCVPSKILIRAGEINHRRAHHPFDGLPGDGGAVDRTALLWQLRGRVDALRQSKYQSILDDNPRISLLRGRARFEDARTLRVEARDGGRGHLLRPDRILIATGASPWIPPTPGLADTPYWTSTEALFADATPRHLLVLGGSFVALEIAQAYRRLGSNVTVLARSTLLSREDPEVGGLLKEALEREGIRVRTHTVPEAVSHDGDAFTIELDDELLNGDRLLVATGRQPNTEALNLAAADVEVDASGAVRVDDHLRTSAGSIFAVGDCTDMPQLVYVAAAAGTKAAVNMTGGESRQDLSVVPAVVFTDPQVATVGFDEVRAREAGIEPDTRRLELENVPRALANFDTHGFVKLVAEAGTGRLIGARIVAHNGGEVIQTAALAIRARMTVDDLAGELFPYLTMAEGLKLCAQTFTRDVSTLSCCAG